MGKKIVVAISNSSFVVFRPIRISRHTKFRLNRITGFFVLENDKVIFRTHTPHRTNHRSEWAQIWHGCPFWQSIWGYRGVFRNSAQEPRYGVPLGGPPEAQKTKNFFFSKNLIFLVEMVSTMSITVEMSTR